MLMYLLVLSVVVSLAFFERFNGVKSQSIFWLATAIIILFVGTRYETGFDWVEYEKFYQYVSPLGDNSGIYVPPDVQMEPGFEFLFSIFRTMGLSFQEIIFIISAFNVSVIAWFSNKYSPRPILVMIWYFGFCLLPAQMAAIRQGLAFSLILVAIVLWQDEKLWKSGIVSISAISVHVFSLAIAPLIYLRDWYPKTLHVAIFALIGVAFSMSSIDILNFITESALSIFGVGNLLADKLSIYNGGAGTAVSPMGLSFVLWDLFFLYLVERRRTKIADEAGSVLVGFAVKCALFSVFAHSFMATFPAVWNRISYISMLVEIVVLTRWYEDVMVDTLKRGAAILGASAISALVLVYGLMAPSALPYLPYQSLLYVWATGDRGDGRVRYAYAMMQAEREMELAKH